MSNSKIQRHCAFCLVLISPEQVKVCGKCKRRAYCSRECQKADWSLEKNGQGHKNWCDLQCGEENLDWKVAPVERKGLGLIALRPFPALFRIIVDSCRETSFPAVQDLMPEGGSFQKKFDFNKLGCSSNDEVDSVLCLRLSRANHDCDPNADHQYDSDHKVKILYALQEIQAGEEICIAYASFNDIGNYIPAATIRKSLVTKWGIDCPENCFCRDEKITKLVKESTELDEQIVHLATFGNSGAAIRKIPKLLENLETLHVRGQGVARTLNDAFQIAVMTRKNISKARQYGKMAVELVSAFHHPKSKVVQDWKEWVEDCCSHPNYLGVVQKLYNH